MAASNAGTGDATTLAAVKDLLLQQKTALATQAEMLVQLTSEVEQLRREVQAWKS